MAPARNASAQVKAVWTLGEVGGHASGHPSARSSLRCSARRTRLTVRTPREAASATTSRPSTDPAAVCASAAGYTHAANKLSRLQLPEGLILLQDA